MVEIRLRDYRAVAFDLDNTITDTMRYPVRACKWLLSRAGLDPETSIEPFISVLVKEYFAGLENVVSGGRYRDPYAIVRTAMENASSIMSLGVSDYILDEATTLFRALHVEVSELRPGAAELLSDLRAEKIRLGIVTNSFEGHIRPILSRLQVLRMFDAVVDPSMVQAYKPMSRPFECLLTLLERSPDETVYIGDEFYADIVGSMRIGMRAVWLNHRKQSLDDYLAKYGDEYRPALVVYDINELRQYF